MAAKKRKTQRKRIGKRLRARRAPLLQQDLSYERNERTISEAHRSNTNQRIHAHNKALQQKEQQYKQQVGYGKLAKTAARLLDPIVDTYLGGGKDTSLTSSLRSVGRAVNVAADAYRDYYSDAIKELPYVEYV